MLKMVVFGRGWRLGNVDLVCCLLVDTGCKCFFVCRGAKMKVGGGFPFCFFFFLPIVGFCSTELVGVEIVWWFCACEWC